MAKKQDFTKEEIKGMAKSFVDKLFPEFTGCDGKIWSDELLEINMHNAAKREDYEYAAKCRNELKRRQKKGEKI